jgi:hypothetical protein
MLLKTAIRLYIRARPVSSSLYWKRHSSAIECISYSSSQKGCYLQTFCSFGELCVACVPREYNVCISI